MPRLRFFCILAATIFEISTGYAAAADGVVPIPTLTLSDEAFLRGETSAGTPVEITAELTGIKAGEQRPVVILLHGTDGRKSGAVWMWRHFLEAQDIATFALDSYTARGIANVNSDQGAAPQFMPIYDAYRAVEVLAGTPGIDPDRIFLMGFSRGGTAALYAALDRFHDDFGPRAGRIAAYLPFYPACNFTLDHELDVVDAPIRIFHGSEDDWTPVAPCRDYIARLAGAGHDAALTEFAGAHHGFDNPGAPAFYGDPEWRTSRACHRVERDGTLVNAETGAAFSYDDACVERGPHTQYDSSAADAAQQAVLGLLHQGHSAAVLK